MSPNHSTGKDDRGIHADFDYLDTQPFDADGVEDDECDDKEWRYFEDTVPFDDDGVLDTEAVVLAGETQVFDGDDDILENEAMNLASETQALGDGETQLLDEVCESDRTQVLENVDDDELSVDSDNGEVDSRKGKSWQRNRYGSMPPRFTFLRAESLRQAALAIHKVDSKENKDVVEGKSGCDQYQESLVVKDKGESFLSCSKKVEGIDQEDDSGKYSVEVGGFKSQVAKSTVRKLFNDDVPIETNGTSLNEGNDLDKLPIYHVDLEGLSYVNSQEPGVLSQVNALDFVDRFLEENIAEFDQETNCVNNMEQKSKSIPSTKRQHSLARTVNDRGKAARTGIYEWDDSREDEGGGDIYLRRKNDFFKGETRRPRSLPGFQKRRVCRLNLNDKNESIPNNRKTAVHSDSKLGMNILKARDNVIPEATIKLKRNLANELDKQFNADCSRGDMEPDANAGEQEMLDVGPDTQMAAEAMEILCNAKDIVDNDTAHVTRSGLTYKLNNSSTGKVGLVSSKEHLGQYDRKRKVDVKSMLQTSGISKRNTKEVRQHTKDRVMSRSKRSKLNAQGNQTSSDSENGRISLSPKNVQRKSARALKRVELHELNNPDGKERKGSSVNKRQLQDGVWHISPIAYRTRRRLSVNVSINLDISSKSLRDGNICIDSPEKSGIGLQASKSLDSKSTTGSFGHCEVGHNSKLSQFGNSALKVNVVSFSDGVELDIVDCPKRRRSLRIRNLSNHDKGSETLDCSSKPSAKPIDTGKSTAGKRKMRTDSDVKSHVNSKDHSSSKDCSVISSVDRKQGKIPEVNLDKTNPRDNVSNSEATRSDELPRERSKLSDLASSTPSKYKRPVNGASPLSKELQSLSTSRPELLTPSKDSRKRRDMTDVRVLYSCHLDKDIIKHQKKILARLGVSVVSSIADATHFIADEFVRTRNMLEAIAFGKLVVTHLWIESCGQANCFIDERNHILRDAKKEKELGFSLPVSLARAVQHPLLKGRRVLITPNTKPSKEMISNLARAVHGQVVESVRSVLNGHTVPDDLLILSCEEDYAFSVPFLEKGAVVYTSELLLNGIVTQKLEYQRHRLFADNVKKTRSFHRMVEKRQQNL